MNIQARETLNFDEANLEDQRPFPIMRLMRTIGDMLGKTMLHVCVCVCVFLVGVWVYKRPPKIRRPGGVCLPPNDLSWKFDVDAPGALNMHVWYIIYIYMHI